MCVQYFLHTENKKARGYGKSKKEAKQLAASNLILILKGQPPLENVTSQIAPVTANWYVNYINFISK